METRTNDVLKALNGDNAAMERLYNETYPKLRAVTVSILKNEDDAEDIIQDTYIKAFSTLKQLDDASKFDAWLCRIASNKCKDYLKKHKPVLFSDMGSGDEDEDPYEWSIEDESGAYNPEEVAITDDTRRQLMELINSLPDEQRICLVYYAVEEMKISEIAQMMEVSESTVKSRLKYAKDKMKTKIEELEKKGVKIRSVSGFALIPFLHYLFATEAKAATAISFSAISEAVAAVAKASSTATTTSASTVAKTVVTEVAKQTGTKAAVGLGAKIASLPLVAKIAAGVVAVGVAVGVPIAVFNGTANDTASSKGDEEIYSEETVVEENFETLNEQLAFEEMVIVDEDDFQVKVLDISIEDNGRYVLDVEFTNKSLEQYDFYISSGYISGIYIPAYEAFDLHCEVESNSSQKTELTIGNRNLQEFVKKFSEIKLNVRVDRKPMDAGGVEDYESRPIYPFGDENVEMFDIGDNYELLIYSSEDVSLYLLDCYSDESPYGNVEINFFIDNRTENYIGFTTEDYRINGSYFDRRRRHANDEGAEVSKNRRMFYTLTFQKSNLEDNYIYELESLAFYATLGNTKNNYFSDIIMMRFDVKSVGFQDNYNEEFLTTGKLTVIHNEYDQNVHFVKMNQVCKYDLDGDGTEEELCVTAKKQRSNWYPYFYYEGSVDVTINGTKYRNVYFGENHSLSSYYCIIDIDKSDSKLHLAIQDYGPSSDYSSAIFEYNNGELNNIDTISGVFDYNHGFYDTVCYGDGTIGSYMHFGVLHTWFGKITYNFENSELTMQKQDYYEATSPSTHTLTTDLTVYEKRSLSSKKTIIPTGSSVSLLGTDNKEWVKIQTQDSKNYWMKMVPEKYSVILVDGQTEMSGSDVFEWLSFAD